MFVSRRFCVSQNQNSLAKTFPFQCSVAYFFQTLLVVKSATMVRKNIRILFFSSAGGAAASSDDEDVSYEEVEVEVTDEEGEEDEEGQQKK